MDIFQRQETTKKRFRKRNHALSRLKERFHSWYTIDDVFEIERLIIQGHSEAKFVTASLDSKDNLVVIYEVKYLKDVILGVFNVASWSSVSVITSKIRLPYPLNAETWNLDKGKNEQQSNGL